MKKLLRLGETIYSSSMLQNVLCRGCPLGLHSPCLLPFPAIRGRSAPGSKTVTNLLTLFLLLPLLLLCCFHVSFQPRKEVFPVHRKQSPARQLLCVLSLSLCTLK